MILRQVKRDFFASQVLSAKKAQRIENQRKMEDKLCRKVINLEKQVLLSIP
jgi:hypothetical protein